MEINEVTQPNQNPSAAKSAKVYQQAQQVDNSVDLSGMLETGFGWVQATDRASRFVRLVEEACKENAVLRNFPVVRINALCGQHGSAAAVVMYFKPTDRHIVNVIYFENNESLSLTVDEKQRENYISTVSRIDESFSEAILKEVQEAGYHNPAYMSANIVPADIIVDNFESAEKIMRQLIASTLGRKQGLLNHLVLDQKQLFNVNVNTFNNDVICDPNGLPQRADFGLRIYHTVKGAETTSHTLTNTTDVAPVEFLSVAYAGLRYVGYQQQQNIVGQLPNLQQIAGEINVTMTSTAARAPMERQLIALALWGKIANQGAWRGPLIDGLSAKRKLSAVARHLYWGQDVSKIDMSQFDKDRNAQNLFLDKFCKPAAALVLTHRIGNGLGGLSGMFADILGKATSASALSDLITLLDKMMPEVSNGQNIIRPKFTDVLKSNLGVSSLNKNHFVAAMVPTVAGSFKSSTGPRSLDDLDLITVCNYFGDKFQDVKNYVELSSFGSRRVDAKEARIALMKYCDEIYGGNSPRYTGEAIQMVLAPKFVATLVSEFSSRATYNMSGASNYVKEETSLFANTEGHDFTVSGFGNDNQIFGDMGQTSINGNSDSVWR